MKSSEPSFPVLGSFWFPDCKLLAVCVIWYLQRGQKASWNELNESSASLHGESWALPQSPFIVVFSVNPISRLLHKNFTACLVWGTKRTSGTRSFLLQSSRKFTLPPPPCLSSPYSPLLITDWSRSFLPKGEICTRQPSWPCAAKECDMNNNQVHEDPSGGISTINNITKMKRRHLYMRLGNNIFEVSHHNSRAHRVKTLTANRLLLISLRQDTHPPAASVGRAFPSGESAFYPEKLH